MGGGRVCFFHPLVIGQVAECTSTIKHIAEKMGRTGSLLFVTIEHEYTQQGRLVFIEYQTIVYREPSPPKKTSKMPPDSSWHKRYQPDATQLFRYSALTFNGHRIHYDYPYATAVEGYENLVIHGPMLATWILHTFASHYPSKVIKTFKFQGVRPATLPDAIDVSGQLDECNQVAHVWAASGGGMIQEGVVTYEESA